MATTTKMKMVMKDGKKVPAFAADKIGKMKKGGMADKAGRAMKTKTSDSMGRAMKKGKEHGWTWNGCRNSRWWCC